MTPTLPPWITEAPGAVETHSRTHARFGAIDAETLLAKVLAVCPMYLDSADHSLVPYLALDGMWASWETVALARLVKPGMFCVDVGANHGYFTLVMARMGAARVLAVEANPRLAALCRRSCEANGVADRVTVEAVAAAERAGTLTLMVRRSLSGGGSVRLDAGPDRLSVSGVPLDTLLADWPRVDLVKIDAEGFEPEVWAGMRETYLRHRPTVVLEFAPGRYADPAGFLRDLCGDRRPRIIRHNADVTEADPAELLTPGFEAMVVV